MSFDLTISFDKAEYLNPQLYMMVDTLKENIPKDTILHITTNRDDNDKVLKWISKQVPTKIYKKEPFTDLKSRCQYMLHAFEIETDKEWVIKFENDILFLQDLKRFNKTIDDEYDVILHTENRRILPDSLETRIWRNIYKAMGIKMPTFKIPYVENKEVGLPLLHTGLVIVKSKHLDYINKRWVPLTKICEQWINFGIHPNEFAFTGLILDAEWDFKIYNDRYNFNPIGHFRKGLFPSVELEENCRLSSDIVALHYHRPKWLKHLSKYNKNVEDIILNNIEYVPEDWWELESDSFVEKP